MKDIFEKLEEVKQKLGNTGERDLDTSEPYYIKGKLTNDMLDLYKGKQDGSIYTLRFMLNKQEIYWWHNSRTKERNINLSEGGIKRLADGSYGFFTNSPDKEGKMQNRQGNIKEPTAGNILYLIEQTDEEFVKLYKAAYPETEIIADSSDIIYHRPQEEIIEDAYSENEEYNKSEERMKNRIAEIDKIVARLLKEKEELQQKLTSQTIDEEER